MAAEETGASPISTSIQNYSSRTERFHLFYDMQGSSRNDSSLPGSMFATVKLAVLYVGVPCLIGVLLSSSSNLGKMQELLSPWLGSTVEHPTSIVSPDDRKLEEFDLNSCFNEIFSAMFQGQPDPFEGLSIRLHRNGESNACDEITLNLVDTIKETVQAMKHCPVVHEKYSAESFLTRVLAFGTSKCSSLEKDRTKDMGLYGFCDMGEEKTPILLDHDKLVPITVGQESFLPCHFHNFNGVRQTTLNQLAELARSTQCKDEGETCSRAIDLYAVPAGRVFMFAPNYVGEIIPLDHVEGGDPTKPVYLEVLSLSPRVFDLVNFFSRAESTDLVERALKEERDSHRIKRSSTGATGYNLNKHRTSESGYDTGSKTAVAVKRRCMTTLGFDTYWESHTDGLQILRYNLTTAYNKHMDWMEINPRLEHDYDSGGRGGNRFATILLYMTDLGERDGGETVFTEAWPPGQPEDEHVQHPDAVKQLRESGDGRVLEPGSWEEDMAASCRSRLAVRPQAGRSVLFYSQLPNGQEDRSSLHGGCPVLSGTKYAANLWAWNTPRSGYSGHPKNPKFSKETAGETTVDQKKGLTAQFENKGTNPAFVNAELYYEDTFWAKLGSTSSPVSVNTFKGHVWRVLVDGVEVQKWTIDANEGSKDFVI